MFIDTHAHLYLENFSEDINDVVQEALNNKVSRIFLPNIDSKSIESLHRLSDTFPDNCFPMMGLHPCSVKENFKDELDLMSKLLNTRKYYGIGETGVDLYWDKTYKKEQIIAFEAQIEWAKNYQLPIIIHSRDSLDITIDIISEYQDGSLSGIFHCFNGTIDQCQKIVDNNFLMGIGGIVTYKNAGLDEMIKYLPEDKLLLETDSPYLSPVPYRGKRNQSAYIPIIAEKIAQIRGVDIEIIMKQSTENAQRIFKLND